MSEDWTPNGQFTVALLDEQGQYLRKLLAQQSDEMAAVILDQIEQAIMLEVE